MITCPFCQFQNEDGALFCDQCKSDLGATEPATAHPAQVTPAPEIAQGLAGPNAVISEVMSPLAAVAVAEATVSDALPMAQLDAGVAAAAEVPIAVAVPLSETTPLTVAPELPGGGSALALAVPIGETQPGSSGNNIGARRAEPAAPTAADAVSPIGAAQDGGAPSDTIPEPPGHLSSSAQPKLVVVRGQRMHVEYPLYEGDNYLGRADEKAVDIDLEDQEPPDRIWSSRQHALITYGDGQLTIEDLNSTNGTFVNRARVHPGQKRPLQANDVIQIGTVQMKVKV
jgi:hypothetical protein